ncbi:MAG TPA: antibiotic biosynthesis monooxygenase family protein [Hyphomonadaceae bacterium]|jgi:heme-degrading monooxygenase HmoA|nr:antibiotic biosynthesis monooxygenase family protein [Hyphomonadaceae bacterium]
MTTISEQSDCVTLINVFTVAPEQQKRLIEMLDRGTETVMRRQPGFVSANIHASMDGRKVANYAQWRSKADFEAMQKNPEATAHMKEIGAMVEKFEPALYEVKSVFEN